MNVTVSLDASGLLPDAYGKYAAAADCAEGMCRRSFPFDVEDIPAGTKALAWVFMDWDSIPVCGFPWIHWCAALTGVEGASRVCVPDDASRLGMPGLLQGRTSAAKQSRALACGYVGPCPPDATHTYTLHVVALDEAPDTAEPFWANELVKAGRGHVLAEASAQLPSRS